MRKAAKRGRQRVNWTATKAEQVLKAWRASGLSLSAFARGQGIVASRLHWWRKQLKKTSRKESSAQKLVPMTLTMAPMTAIGVGLGPVVVHDRTGMLIEITEPERVSPEWLAAMVGEMGRRT